MKNVSSTEDLAINGAPPAFEKILHVGNPNLGNRDLFQRFIDEIYERNWLTNDGPLVKALEAKIAQHHNVEHCIAMCNGTIALEIAIRALQLQGEVIVPSYTFIATAHALHWQEITPVFADIDPSTHNLDPASVRRMITPRTTGIIGVHLWGRSAPVEELKSIADEHHLQLLFDSAHAFGCSYRGKLIGGFGECEVLSLHATKFFNSLEGGAILTNNTELAEKVRLMRNFGFSGLDNVIHPGTNGKMNEVCAAAGLVNFESMKDVLAANKANYESYCTSLSAVPGISVLKYDEAEHNNYQYIVLELGNELKPKRDFLINALHAENVRARKYFWPGCHKMHPYASLYPHAGLLLRNTEDVAERVIVMPTGPAVSDKDISTIADLIRVIAAA